MRQLLRLYQETLAETLRRFGDGELKMMIDVSNSTYLASGIMGQQMIPNIEDAFALDPGRYEQKWGIESEPMLTTLRALDMWQLACLEIWANELWYGGGTGDVDIEGYLRPPAISEELARAGNLLQEAVEQMGKSRGAFKSATIAQARTATEQALSILRAHL